MTSRTAVSISTVLRVIFLALIAIALAMAAPLHAKPHIRITNSVGAAPRWTQMPVRYFINEDGSPQIPNGSEFPATFEALGTWEAVADAAVSFEYGGTTSGGIGLDGQNVVTFDEDSGVLGSATLAATFSFFQGGASNPTFREADIAFNARFDFTTSGEPGRFDIRSILTHEAGHMLGLDHSGIVSSVMSPFAFPGQADQRVLQYDDIAGIRGIYPDTSVGSPPTGRIEGRVLSDSGPVTGAHVVALDRQGAPLVSTMSNPDGSYALDLLPPGGYRVYAEPLDGPVTSAHVPSYFRVAVDFGTTFLGDTASLSEAAGVSVAGGAASTGHDIHVRPAGTTGFNLTSPVFATRLVRGQTGDLPLGGDRVEPGATFSLSTPDVIISEPSFGGRMSATAPTSARIPATVPQQATLGPGTIIGVFGDTTSLVSGMFVVTNPPPGEIAVSPSAGESLGGVVVQIQGRDFRPGVSVYFGGLRASPVQFLNSGVLQATVPQNSPGPSNVQVFNLDGTNGVLENGFEYTVPPPTISAVVPPIGPPGTRVIIEGANFDSRPQNVTVRFNGRLARVVASTPARIETVVPFATSTGPLTVTVFGATAAGGTFTVTDPVASTNTAPPEVEGIDASPEAGGTQLRFSSDDDGVYFMDLPFSFGLFTDTFIAGEQISIATNGWISLDGESSPEFQNTALPAASSERPSGSLGRIARALIAPMFDDLTFEGGGEVSTLTTGTSPNRKLVVQWAGCSILDEVGNDLGADLTFTVLLYEGSNDIRFIYGPLSGPRADGSSATIGLQNLARNAAVQTSHNAPFLESGKAVTYRFIDGAYTEEVSRQAVSGQPIVSDGGEVTANRSELIASWVDPVSPGSVIEYDYAIGSWPGGTDVRAFSTVVANSVVATGLSLLEGKTYYIAVRGRNSAGVSGPVGVSDGIRVDTAFTPAISIFPTLTEGGGAFGGIALMAETATSVVLRAINSSGGLPVGLGILNPVTVHLETGEQSARLISEIFGLSWFDGWVELESSTPSLRSYVSTGATDLSSVDGVGPSPALTDFLLLHDGATALLVNPGLEDVTAEIEPLGSGIAQSLLIPARSRRITTLSDGPVRIASPAPIAAAERFGSAEALGIGGPIDAPSPSLVFPHAVVGGGYESWVTVANLTAAPAQLRVTFGGRTWDPGGVAGRSTLRLPLSGGSFDPSSTVSGDVRIAGATPFSSLSIAGSIDIARAAALVTVAATPGASEVVFPHVADLDALFTGIAIAAGPAGASVSIDIFTASGEPSGSGTVSLEANGGIAKLVRELVPDFAGQNGGYIRVRSDTPIWAWEIYGTLDAMASGPPL